MAILERGKHLFVEKPLTMNVEEAETIVRAAAGRRSISMVGYSLRFDPRYVAMKQAIDSGDVGNLLYITARRNPSIATLERLDGRVELPFWVGVHDIDMMRWVTGSEVARVFARATPPGFKRWGVRGAYFALLTFASGVVAQLENAWEATAAGRPQSYAFRVQGSGGLVEVRSHEQGVTIHRADAAYAPDTVYSLTSYGVINGVYRDELAYFVRCVKQGTDTEMPVLTGLEGVRVADAIMRSAAQGTEIVLEAPVSAGAR
jgi:UDP-N-acetylglucosamine 3-dehydrogenase